MPKRNPENVNLSATYPLAPSTIETIDQALYNYFDEKLNIFCTTNEGFVKVPVIFGSAERAYQIKEDRTLREYGRTLKYPLISINKTGITQNPANKGRYGTYIPPFFRSGVRPSSIDIARVVNQDKTKNFTNADAIRKSEGGANVNHQTFPGQSEAVVYNTLSVPMPAFLEVVYSVDLVSNFQQQMNEMLAPVITAHSTPVVFPIFNEGNRYEAFLEPSYNIEANAAGLNVEERSFRASLNFTVLGHIIGGDKNQASPNVVVNESAAKIRIQRERVIVQSEPHFDTRFKDKYRP
jgi:hypothetical protein